MINNPKVSVVLSVYNGQDSIGETINSILNQTFTDFELIIVNDCSTDNTTVLLNKFTYDKRVIIIFNDKNIGLTKSLIKGISFSKGELIARIDSGDLMKIDRLEKQVNSQSNKLK